MYKIIKWLHLRFTLKHIRAGGSDLCNFGTSRATAFQERWIRLLNRLQFRLTFRSIGQMRISLLFWWTILFGELVRILASLCKDERLGISPQALNLSVKAQWRSKSPVSLVGSTVVLEAKVVFVKAIHCSYHHFCFLKLNSFRLERHKPEWCWYSKLYFTSRVATAVSTSYYFSLQDPRSGALWNPAKNVYGRLLRVRARFQSNADETDLKQRDTDGNFPGISPGVFLCKKLHLIFLPDIKNPRSAWFEVLRHWNF